MLHGKHTALPGKMYAFFVPSARACMCVNMHEVFVYACAFVCKYVVICVGAATGLCTVYICFHSWMCTCTHKRDHTVQAVLLLLGRWVAGRSGDGFTGGEYQSQTIECLYAVPHVTRKNCVPSWLKPTAQKLLDLVTLLMTREIYTERAMLSRVLLRVWTRPMYKGICTWVVIGHVIMLIYA